MASGGLFGGDTPEIVDAFIDQTGVTFPVGWDRNGSYTSFILAADPGLSPFPVDVIVAPGGTLLYVEPQYDAAVMSAIIEALLDEP